jgi:alkylated DNA repair protein alkB family protein 1
MSSTTTSSYKEAYNRHRRRPHNEGFRDDFPYLLDFSNPEEATAADFALAPCRTTHIVPIRRCDNCIYKGRVFGIQSHPGFLYIPQALSKNIQIDLAYLALTQFCEAPHRTNIDLLPVKKGEIWNGEEETMWKLWKRVTFPLDESHDGSDNMKGVNSIQKLNAIPESTITGNKTKSNQQDEKFYKTFEKLSWATMGYHYDWTERSYKEELQSPMPPVLKILGSLFAQLDTLSSGTNERFCASASIVNYYSLKSTMGGHKDDLEYDFTKPVVSLSIGLAAVFLLGGRTKDDGPVVPILVRPGDVMLLGGESRLCYHGIARVIPEWVELPSIENRFTRDDWFHNDETIHSWNELFVQMKTCGIDEVKELDCPDPRTLETPKSDLEAVERFLSKHRLNINLRQVLPFGMTSIPCKNKVL